MLCNEGMPKNHVDWNYLQRNDYISTSFSFVCLLFRFTFLYLFSCTLEYLPSDKMNEYIAFELKRYLIWRIIEHCWILPLNYKRIKCIFHGVFVELLGVTAPILSRHQHGYNDCMIEDIYNCDKLDNITSTVSTKLSRHQVHNICQQKLIGTTMNIQIFCQFDTRAYNLLYMNPWINQIHSLSRLFNTHCCENLSSIDIIHRRASNLSYWKLLMHDVCTMYTQ